ncbi:hypothetical protein J010_05512 [Cryptococcus neoformans]|nr:hypothetical protein C355_05463 [Cryptococcus neoformans var. grubii Th84]OXH03916.1 hypothetical protein J010_05512 [Cryptococcus neoformans var. grubii]OXH25688.1 hypothetical protein J009_05507 [Cryptococcus neoformans var. grubii]OXH45354.1 hypothetical protein J004_05562 [Cryptococcus neoformans var. grubii]OXH46479.1 hypothetical protein J003_05454 [Cryptococcus neoformans var. grubii]
MRPTSILAGASRIPLTGKRGNKDFYKGTGQSRVPGAGHRTGAPGVHVVRGKSKYRLLDDRVRVFVGPGKDALDNTELRPYVATRDDDDQSHTTFFNPFSRASASRPNLPSFSPNVPPPAFGERLTRKDYTRFSKKYAQLSLEERQWVVMEQRRKWWAGMMQLYGKQDETTSAQESERLEGEEKKSA